MLCNSKIVNTSHCTCARDKLYASRCEVCHSNDKYHVIKFNIKYVPPLDPRRPFANKFF